MRAQSLRNPRSLAKRVDTSVDGVPDRGSTPLASTISKGLRVRSEAFVLKGSNDFPITQKIPVMLLKCTKMHAFAQFKAGNGAGKYPCELRYKLDSPLTEVC